MNFKFPESYKANRPKPFQWLGKILIKLSGWKIKGQISDLYKNKKFVAIVAPHTSYTEISPDAEAKIGVTLPSSDECYMVDTNNAEVIPPLNWTELLKVLPSIFSF